MSTNIYVYVTKLTCAGRLSKAQYEKSEQCNKCYCNNTLSMVKSDIYYKC